MSTPPVLSQEEIKRINDEALAAVERGRAMLARSQEVREQLGGDESEQIEKVLASLPGYSRTLMSRFVNLQVYGSINGAPPPARSAGKARKSRQLV